MQIEYQLLALPLQSGKHCVLKHVIFPELVKMEILEKVCFGKCHSVMWHRNVKTPQALQHMRCCRRQSQLLFGVG